MSLTTDSADSPIWVLRRFDKARQRAMVSLFATLPLQDPAQHFTLFALECAHKAGDIPTQRDIARLLQLSPATVTATLRSLERSGLLQRYQDARDQRKNRVEITEAGLETAAECRNRMDALEGAMFLDFTPEELEQLSGYFARMCHNLNALKKEEGEP